MRILGFSVKVAAAMMAVCALLLASCERSAVSSILEVSVKSPSVAAVSGQQFVSVKADGNWTLTLVSGSGSVDWASLDVPSGTGSKNNIILTYKANTSKEPRSLTLVLGSGSRSVNCEVTQSGAGEQPEPDPMPVPDVDLAKTGWLELPAMDDENLDYYSHNFEMNGKTYRNYSFGWSQKDLVSVWMAYPLCKMYTNKTVGRTDEWAYDPLLGSEYSSAPFGGYGGNYARGHQVPSADRLCSYEANSQTFYGTNITPQLNAHNEGVWQSLENAVRNWANTSDTTYVVTGCVVEGATEFTVDSDKKKMTVPVAYYKALIRYHKASTISQWSGAAFYLEHKAYSGADKNITKDHPCVISVDELEEITGIDFFVNLPAKVGDEMAAKLEAEDPAKSNVWW